MSMVAAFLMMEGCALYTIPDNCHDLVAVKGVSDQVQVVQTRKV